MPLSGRLLVFMLHAFCGCDLINYVFKTSYIESLQDDCSCDKQKSVLQDGLLLQQ